MSCCLDQISKWTTGVILALELHTGIASATAASAATVSAATASATTASATAASASALWSHTLSVGYRMDIRLSDYR